MMRDGGKPAHDYTGTWCKGGEIGYVELSGGARVRYLRVGSGPPLVLMHAVRTQLDHFQRVIPLITEAYTVYADDSPGMGWSDIVPGASYEEPASRAAVVKVVEDLNLSVSPWRGESMGATLSLTASVASASECAASSPSTPTTSPTASIEPIRSRACSWQASAPR